MIVLTLLLISCKNPTMPEEPLLEPVWQIDLQISVDGKELDSTRAITAGINFEVKITLSDTDGNIVRDENVSLVLDGPGNFVVIREDNNIEVMTIDPKPTGENGEVVFSNLRITTAGEYNISVSASEQSIISSTESFEIVPAEPFVNFSEFIDLPVSVTVDEEVEFKVKVKDRFENHIKKDGYNVYINPLFDGSTKDRITTEFMTEYYIGKKTLDKIGVYMFQIQIGEFVKGGNNPIITVTQLP